MMYQIGKIQPFIMVIPDGYLSYYSDTYDGSSLYETFFIKELVPYIDNNYRTRKDINGRSIIGFSMGGFGALSVSLRNRHLFGSVVALSPSIRTEKQYIEEGPQKGWDNQWGRIFGGVGKNGKQRLTSYYKQHSPYHILSTLRNSDLKGFGIMLDIGDKEGTLCESNEEIGKILGIDRNHNMVIIGAGNLGKAIVNYSDFEKRGFVIKGIFDNNPKIKGTKIRGIEERMMNELTDFIKNNDIEIVALTIPKEAARQIAKVVVDAGVKAIWNFAHTDLNLPDDVIVENVHLSESLMRLSYTIANRK